MLFGEVQMAHHFLDSVMVLVSAFRHIDPEGFSRPIHPSRLHCKIASQCEQSGKNWPVRTESDSKAIRHLPAPAEEETSIELSKRLRSKSKSEKQAFSNN